MGYSEHQMENSNSFPPQNHACVQEHIMYAISKGYYTSWNWDPYKEL